MSDTIPDLSVVVAAFSDEGSLRRCLDSLRVGAPTAEVIVVLNREATSVARTTAEFPEARFIFRPDVESVFRLRSLGVPMARGRVVALIEGHCTVCPEWSATVLAAHHAARRVVGGPIDNGRIDRVYDWALYFCEYSEYMPPRAEGATPALLGPNVTYDREALWQCRPTWGEVFYDNEINDALREQGYQLYMAPRACVYSHLTMTLLQAMFHLYSGGRRFGGYRKSRSSAWQRVFWVLVSPLVPGVLFWRIGCRVASRRPERLLTFILGIPFVACLLLAWAIGEAVGYVARPPTNARFQGGSA